MNFFLINPLKSFYDFSDQTCHLLDVKYDSYGLTSGPIVTIFCVKHPYCKMNHNCESHGSTTPEVPKVGPNIQKIQLFLLHFFFASTNVGEN